AYFATVRNGKTQEVALEYHPPEGWAAVCTCPMETGCEHAVAALRALLAEHSRASVRGLSTGGPAATAALAASRSAPTISESSELVRRLMAKRQQPLTPQECRFIAKVRSIFARCRSNGYITPGEFNEMGLHLSDYTWGTLEIWPAMPDNEYLFWLYVARAAKERGVRFPEFMEPITDFSEVEAQLTRWKRQREIEQWSQRLRDVPLAPAAGEAPDKAQTDLRVVIGPGEARLEWLRPGQAAFEKVKQGAMRQFTERYDEGEEGLTPEAELIWQLFTQRDYYGLSLRLQYDDSDGARALGRLLRIRQLDSRIVTQNGQPLARPAEPWRWEVAAPEEEAGDYRVRLVQAGGSPTPEVLCVIPGIPTLYLTADAVFPGPPPHERVLSPYEDTRIPAPAIERAPGVAFLQAIGAELPARVRERIRTVPYEVTIQCALRPTFRGSEVEECVVTVKAQAPDGRRLSWEGYNWLQEQAPTRSKTRGEGNLITLYDNAPLEAVPRLLEPLNLKPSNYNRGLVLRVTRKFADLFSAWLKSVPPQIKVDLGGDLASFTEAAIAGRVKLDVVEAEIDWFDLRVVLDVSDTTLTQEEIKLLLNARGSYVRLEGKGWRRLQYDLGADENERLARLGLNPGELSAEPQRLHALQLADDAARRFLPEQQVERIQRRAGEIKARVAPDLPAGVTAQLRPYQLEGFHFLAYLSTNRFGGILADDMGLGKTLQALAWLLWLRAQPPAQRPTPQAPRNTPDAPHDAPTDAAPASPPSLVVCPKSVMDNWHAEAAHFTPGFRVKLWSASELDTLPDRLGEADLHVLNYAQLRLVGERLAPVRWLAVILDEGQYIKNPNSQTARVARSLRSEHRLVLTGTPIENRLLDLWSIMGFAMPGVLGQKAQFARSYDSKSDPLGRQRLAARVRPFLLRRTKAQVAKDLPDRTEEDLFCEIEGEQKTLYRAEMKRAQQMLLSIQTQKELAKQQFNFLVSLLRLRQICCHPRLVQPESKAASAKTEALLEQLEPLMDEGEKVLVFSQFVELLDLLRPAIEERGWPLFYLTGSTENRGELVRNFQSTEGPAVFLISLKAGGFGLNLTAASYVVLFDPWWNPAVENQAIDRTHRIGQVNKVMAYRLLIKDSIEEKIRLLQKKKKALAEDVLGEERFAQSLTLDDLRFLFSE
ncbi:MAG TPA: DEAD/DEAH box helicase, partial [Candidatus Acidoferrum sp.]|nr:DEAD/DEAH box helicase [Candidatus Acidoferrum sp.]